MVVLLTGGDWEIVMYDKMCGKPPFYNLNKSILFELILHEENKFLKNCSLEAKKLLNGLLTKNPDKRLGGGPDGAKEIKLHPLPSSRKMFSRKK